jgi:hypothetical protein
MRPIAVPAGNDTCHSRCNSMVCEQASFEVIDRELRSVGYGCGISQHQSDVIRVGPLLIWPDKAADLS